MGRVEVTKWLLEHKVDLTVTDKVINHSTTCNNSFNDKYHVLVLTLDGGEFFDAVSLSQSQGSLRMSA